MNETQKRRFLSGIEKVLWVLHNNYENEQEVTDISMLFCFHIYIQELSISYYNI